MQLIVVVVERGQKTLHTTLRYSISNLCMHFSDLLDLYPRVRVWVVAPTRIETHGIPCDQFNRSHAHAAANKPLTRHTNTERATAQRQRRLIVEVVVAAPKLPPSAALLLSSLLFPVRTSLFSAFVVARHRPTAAYSLKNNQQVTRTQDTPTDKTPPTPAHTRARQDPQTNTSHKHLTTLNGGATTVRATSPYSLWFFNLVEWSHTGRGVA